MEFLFIVQTGPRVTEKDIPVRFHNVVQKRCVLWSQQYRTMDKVSNPLSNSEVYPVV
jgi:hypothetical protein